MDANVLMGINFKDAIYKKKKAKEEKNADL